MRRGAGPAVELPVQAAKGAGPARVGQARGVELGLACGVEGQPGHHLVELHRQTLLELPHHMVAEQPGQLDPGQAQRQRHGHQRGRQQAQAQRRRPTRSGGSHGGCNRWP